MRTRPSARRAFVRGLAAVVLAPRVCAAQATRKTAKVGVLAGGGLGFEDGFDAFRRRLRELGYVDGESIAFVVRNAGGRADRYAAVARDLVALAPDVIVVQGNAALAALQKITRTIPIVMANIGDPVGAGFVASLARPGGNITGLSNMGEGIAAKWLDLIKEATPKATRVGVLRDPHNAAHASMLAEIERAGRALGVVARPLDAASPGDVERAIEAGRRDIDVLIALPQPATSARPDLVIALAARHRLPAVYLNRSFAEAGGLLSYGPSITDLWRGAAEFVDRILKGAKPADLPVDQPTRFELAINLKTAHALGLTIPPAMLVRADHVIR